MFEKYDPGFLAGFIGVVMTFTFTFIFQQIKIIYRFSERLKILEAKVKVIDRIVPMGTDSGVLPSELVQEASDMVKEGHNVPRFHLIKRYRKSKRMAKLILDIKERSSLLLEIVIYQRDPARNLAADLQMVAHTVEETAAAEEQAMAHTDAVEQTAAAEGQALEEQAMAHTDAVEETAAAEGQAMAHTDTLYETAAAEGQAMAHTDTLYETAAAEETGLRQRVGTRKKIVLKSMIEDDKSKRRAIKAIAGVEGVESVSVDMKTKKVVVVGEVDPVFLSRKLREFGYTELWTVGPAIEEKKAEGEKKVEPPLVVYLNPSSYAPYSYSVVTEARVSLKKTPRIWKHRAVDRGPCHRREKGRRREEGGASTSCVFESK